MDEPGEKLDKALARSEVEGEVRAEYAEAARDLLSGERDKRAVALAISITMAVCLLLPLAALVLGLSWRVLKWAAGG